MDDDFDGDIDFDWEKDQNPEPGPENFDLPPAISRRNQRYNNAYGNYRGGYGPVGGFGPGGFGPGAGYGPRGDFGPPRFPGPYGPPRPMPNNLIWGRGFGPDGPPPRRGPRDDKPIRYLMRCGIPKENLRNLPPEMLQLIQPQFCGLCAQHLISFSISRTHYTSKNHLKNQKKWLVQRGEAGKSHPREIPLKARDLYCELCDVHITSKIHADSHYAGKPHRAIVEGRKQPKNPFLLNRSNAGRLEQLIRREKKNLKPIEEKKEEETPVPKNVDSELYCEICKTSVTCTDQMTMHLNGKRHLNKEKRHIFNMMKIQSGDTSADANAEENDEEEEEEEEEENENGNGNENETEMDNQDNDWPSGEHDL